jgi:hypothetical protein
MFEFVRESDDARVRCEIRSHPRPGGFEVQVFMNGELYIKQKFGRRDWALAWAEFKRDHLAKGHW